MQIRQVPWYVLYPFSGYNRVYSVVVGLYYLIEEQEATSKLSKSDSRDNRGTQYGNNVGYSADW